MTPNLGKPLRLLYVAFGVTLLILPLFMTFQPWMRIGVIILGILSILGGASGL